MDDKLLPGLALAAISGLTFVAYKHPEGYTRLLKPIGIVSQAIFLAALIWDISGTRAYFRLYDYLEPIKREAAKAAVDNAEFLNGYIVAGYMAAGLYLGFLAFLPQILGEEKPPKKKGE